jgi:hypothetical protein
MRRAALRRAPIRVSLRLLAASMRQVPLAASARIGRTRRRRPRIWFQVVPESKTVQNRPHLDIHASGGRGVPIATRRKRVDAEARRLTDLGATTIRALEEEGIDHYAVAMKDPEDNEFDIN